MAVRNKPFSRQIGRNDHFQRSWGPTLGNRFASEVMGTGKGDSPPGAQPRARHSAHPRRVYPFIQHCSMQGRFRLAALAFLGLTALYYFTRTKSMTSNAEQPQLVKEDTTPQQQEQQNPEPAPRPAPSGLRPPIPFLSPDDLVRAQGKPGGGRITLPVQPPVDS